LFSGELRELAGAGLCETGGFDGEECVVGGGELLLL
jgi:hypothetical protein